MYTNDKTLWVEPETGAVIDRNEHTVTALAFDGEDRVTATDANLEYTDETVAANVEDLGDKGSQLGLARTTAPLVAGVLGLVLLGLGVLLGRRRSRVGRPPPDPAVLIQRRGRQGDQPRGAEGLRARSTRLIPVAASRAAATRARPRRAARR